MFERGSIRRALATLIGLAVVALAGCRHYRADVTVNPDGSGSRTVTLTWEQGTEGSIPPDSDLFRELFGVTAVRGWSPMEGGDGKVSGYRLTEPVRTPSVWQYRSGDIRVSGSERNARVYFTNTVRLDRTRTDAGLEFDYRETFTWTGLFDVLIRFHTSYLAQDLASGFPDLSAEERAELKGILTGMLATRLLQLSLDEGADVETEDLEQTFIDVAEETLRRNHPDLDRERLVVLASTVFDDTEDELDAFLAEQYPGAHETVFTDITIRVTLPGLIVESNADEIEGSTAEWTVNIWDALARPREIRARAVLSN